MKNIEQSTDTRSLYTRASFVVFGGVCAVLMANQLLLHMTNWDEPPVFPGFRFMAQLCYPILYFWGGLLLRAWKPNPKWWVQLIVLLVSVFFMYCYLHRISEWWFVGHLYLALAGIGYLIPTKIYLGYVRNQGWISIVMLLLSIFCYTAIEVVKNRLFWRPIIPEHPDMALMMKTILGYANPMMTIVVIYFVVQLAFSQESQYLGSQSWFRGTVAVPCIFMFLGEMFELQYWHHFYKISHAMYSPFLRFIVQPITIYLIIVVCRCIRELRKKKEDRMSWKEMLRLN